MLQLSKFGHPFVRSVGRVAQTTSCSLAPIQLNVPSTTSQIGY